MNTMEQETCWTLIDGAAAGNDKARETFVDRYLPAVRACTSPPAGRASRTSPTSRTRYSDEMVGFANYSWTTRRDRKMHRRNRLAPRHKGNIGLRWSPANGVRGMLWATFYDETELDSVKVDDFIMLNGSLSWPVGDYENVRAYISGFNLLDQNHKEHTQTDSYGALLSAGLRITF